MKSTKFYSCTILAVLLLAGFAGLMVAPGSPVGEANAYEGDGRGYVCITFDDGMKSIYDTAYPVMKSFNIPGTMYPIVYLIGREGRVSTSDLLALQADGWDIGSHGNHVVLTNRTIEQAIAEMSSSKAALEAMGLNITSFAYPFGAYNATIETAAEGIYQRIMTTDQLQAFMRHFPAQVTHIGRMGWKTWAEVTASIDRAIKEDAVVFVNFHDISPDGDFDINPKTDYSIQQLCEYIDQRRTSDGLRPITVKDLDTIGVDNCKVWTATGNGLLSDGANYAGGVAPVAGDHIIIPKRGTSLITIDEEIVLGDIQANFHFAGGIVQGDVPLHYRSLLMFSGSMTPSTTLMQTCDYSYCVGTMGMNGLLTLANGGWVRIPNGNLKHLAINGDTQLLDRCAVDGTLSVAPDVEVAILETQLQVILRSTTSYSNQGEFTGQGRLLFYMYSNKAVNVGRSTAPVWVTRAATGGTASYTMTLTAGLVDGGPLIVSSDHPTATSTLDLNGHSLQCSGITVRTRGVLLGGEGVIRNYGNFDSSAGTWTPETSEVIINGDGTMKLGAGQTFYDLTVPAGSSLKLLSDVEVTNGWDLQGTIDLNGFRLTVPEGDENQIISTPSETVAEDAAYSYTPQSNHAGTFTVTTDADWLTWDGTTLSGTPHNEDVGSYSVSVKFENGVSTIFQNYTLNVTNVAPVFLQDPITEWSYGTTYLYDPQTDEEWHGVTYSFTATGGMDWWIEPDSGILRCHITDTTPTDISIMADDGNGGLAWLNYTVTISSLPWDHEVIIGYEESQNYRVAFTFLVDNSQAANVERVQWNFGDGNGSRDASPVHTYDRPGKYVITCWVRLYDGTASATNMEITVGDPATVEDIDQRIAQQLNDAMLYVSLVAIIGLISMWAYARWAGSRGKFDKLVLALIGVAMLAVSVIIIGGALQ